MDKSKVCITKAMKAVAPSQCNKKQNLLVYDKRDPCYVQPPKRKEMYTVTPLSSPAAKKIKVCTGADLKRMCKPKLCHCPPKKSMNATAVIMRFIGSTFKAAFAGALVYWTYEMGIWGPPTQTEQIYFDMCQAVCETTYLSPEEAEIKLDKLKESCPNLKKAICPKDTSVDQECCKYPPNFEQTYFKMSEFWNCGVTCFFDFLAHGPQRVHEFWIWTSTRLGLREETCVDKKCKKKDHAK